MDYPGRLPRNLVESLSFEIHINHLDTNLATHCSCPRMSRGWCGPDNLKRSLPVSETLWFCPWITHAHGHTFVVSKCLLSHNKRSPNQVILARKYFCQTPKLWPKPWPFAWFLEAPGIKLFASSNKLLLPLSRNVLHDAWLMCSKAVTVLHPYAWTDGLRCPDATALVRWLGSSLNWRKSFGFFKLKRTAEIYKHK